MLATSPSDKTKNQLTAPYGEQSHWQSCKVIRNTKMEVPGQHAPERLDLRVLWFHIRGELDVSTAHRTRTEYPAALGNAADALLVDVSEITFLDCNGIRQLLGMHHMAQLNGCPIAFVTGGNRLVHRLSSILSLDRKLPLYEDYDGGMRALLTKANAEAVSATRALEG